VAALAGDAVPGAPLDATELFDVDVNELAGDRALIALGRLEPEPVKPAHPDPGQDPRHGRQRPVEDFGNFGAGEAQPPQGGDHLDGLLIGAIGDDVTRRAAIHKPDL
jgi:hypothetical protein